MKYHFSKETIAFIESAATDAEGIEWWRKQTDAFRESYLKLHPKSKFGKVSVTKTAEEMEKERKQDEAKRKREQRERERELKKLKPLKGLGKTRGRPAKNTDVKKKGKPVQLPKIKTSSDTYTKDMSQAVKKLVKLGKKNVTKNHAEYKANIEKNLQRDAAKHTKAIEATDKKLEKIINKMKKTTDKTKHKELKAEGKALLAQSIRLKKSQAKITAMQKSLKTMKDVKPKEVKKPKDNIPKLQRNKKIVKEPQPKLTREEKEQQKLARKEQREKEKNLNAAHKKAAKQIDKMIKEEVKKIAGYNKKISLFKAKKAQAGSKTATEMYNRMIARAKKGKQEATETLKRYQALAKKFAVKKKTK